MELCYNTVQLLGYEQCFWRTTGVKGVEVEPEKGKGKTGYFTFRPTDDSISVLFVVIDRDYNLNKKGTSTAWCKLTLKH